MTLFRTQYSLEEIAKFVRADVQREKDYWRGERIGFDMVMQREGHFRAIRYEPTEGEIATMISGLFEAHENHVPTGYSTWVLIDRIIPAGCPLLKVAV